MVWPPTCFTCCTENRPVRREALLDRFPGIEVPREPATEHGRVNQAFYQVMRERGRDLLDPRPKARA